MYFWDVFRNSRTIFFFSKSGSLGILVGQNPQMPPSILPIAKFKMFLSRLKHSAADPLPSVDALFQAGKHSATGLSLFLFFL